MSVKVTVDKAATVMNYPVQIAMVRADDGAGREPGGELRIVRRAARLEEDGWQAFYIRQEPVPVAAIGWGAAFGGWQGDEPAGLIKGALDVFERFPDVVHAGAVGEQLPASPVQAGHVATPQEVLRQRTVVEHHAVEVAPVQVE